MSKYIYTDGACSGNPGPGSFAFIVIEDNKIIHQAVDYAKYTTNNRMELMAVIDALKYDTGIPIYTDSQYVYYGYKEWMAKWIVNAWKNSTGKKVMNDDLWMELYEYKNVDIYWVKGHADNYYNNYVNDIAQKSLQKMKNSLIY